MKVCTRCGTKMERDDSKKPLSFFDISQRLTDVSSTSACVLTTNTDITHIMNKDIKPSKKIIDLICPKCKWEDQDII